MNVCRVQLKGMNVCTVVAVTDSNNIAAINWKSHVFIQCPQQCTTIFPFVLCSAVQCSAQSTKYKIFSFSYVCDKQSLFFICFNSIDIFIIQCDCKPISVESLRDGILISSCWFNVHVHVYAYKFIRTVRLTVNFQPQKLKLRQVLVKLHKKSLCQN